MSRPIGVSVLSLFPHCWGRRGILRVLDIVEPLELGLQLLPLWGWTRHSLQIIPKDMVLSYEYPWLPSHRAGFIVKRVLAGDWPATYWPFLFGLHAHSLAASFKTVFPNAIGIDTEDNGVIETHPRRNMSPVQWCEYRPGVAVDTWHIREKPRIALDTMVFLKRLVESGNVKMIHLQTRDGDELKEFVGRGTGTLHEYLKILKGVGSNVPVIIELSPAHIFFSPRRLLRAIKERIEDSMS